MLRLYTYFRSSAAYRVRIALNLKGLAYEAVPVHLLRDGGQQNQPDYRALSPLGTVPALQTGDGTFTQSLAIIEYLDEIHPLPPLLPTSAEDRARVRALAQTVACDIHPVNNLRVLQYLGREFGATQEQKDAWYRHWVSTGLLAVEQLLAGDQRTGSFCHGETPGLADCCLAPQVFNARRFDCPLDDMPTLRRIVAACEQLAAFQNAAPAMQPDAE
jgi:maleylacetoacetate isomerase/maleylpyruvate isomerase